MKRRRKALWAFLLLIALLLVCAAGLGLLLKQEPDYYTRDTTLQPQPTDPARASVAQTKLLELQSALELPKPAAGEWLTTLSDEELNAYLREDPNTWNLVAPALAPLYDLRLGMEDDILVVGARYGTGTFSTVVWAEFKLWLIPTEPNLVAVELLNLRAGAIPLNKNWIMDRMGKFAVGRGADVTWYRGENRNPVGVFRLRAKLSQPDVLVTLLSVAEGQISIGVKNLLGP